MIYFRGFNPLHVLASYAKENAAAIFELFRQTMPNYPFDALDGDESTGEKKSSFLVDEN